MSKNAYEEDSNQSSSDAEEMAEGDINPKLAAKKAMKAERKERRKQKKDLKMAFKNQGLKYHKQQTVATAGDIRPGVSVKKIY